MAISFKPQHLQRYKNIARLLLKYGRGDLLRNSGLDEPGIAAGRSGQEMLQAMHEPTVHERPGEILERGNGAAPAEETEPGDRSEAQSRVEEIAQRAGELADDLERMGPTYVKVGQFLSTRGDVLPMPHLLALSRLQDRVGPFPFEDVERIVSEELGVRLSKAFARFDRTPVAAASLGQVHRAELRDGTEVAVKVQRPDIRPQITQDLEVLADIAEFLDKHTELGRTHGFSGMLEELRKSLFRELDYRLEARNLTILGQNLAGFSRVMVPRPIDDYVTSRILTMEFVHGRKATSIGPLSKLEVDGTPLAEQLCRAYLQQILVDGFFHADPHPGNVFLTDDARLALLDLGMVGHVAPNLQESLLKLILAVSEGRGEDAGSAVLEIGTPVGELQPEQIRASIAALVMECQGQRLADIALGRMLFDVARVGTEGGMRMPRELTMLSKTLLNVDEVARRLDPQFDPNAAIRRNASEIMRQRMLKSLSPGKLFAGLIEAKQFAEKLPRRLNHLIDAIADNRLRVQVDAINEVLLMEGLQKIANRITLGLVISAMIVGAALLMRIETRFRILGYPGLAILFFIGAALSGLFLIWNIVIHDMRAGKERLRANSKGTGSAPVA